MFPGRTDPNPNLNPSNRPTNPSPGKHLYSLDANSTINALCFSPKNYWLCAATDTSIKIWDLENKNVLDELTKVSGPNKNGLPWCVSLQWSADGNTLFAGSTDGNIYVYQIGRS